MSPAIEALRGIRVRHFVPPFLYGLYLIVLGFAALTVITVRYAWYERRRKWAGY